MRLSNYLADVNTFGLAPPPAYVLRQLWEFDPSIVILPSRQEAYHLLAQRDRSFRPMKTIEAEIVTPDEAMLRSYGLVSPIKLISITGAWNWASTDLRPYLAARSVERQGGWQKVEAAILEQEERDRLARLHYRHEDILVPRIRAGARAMQFRNGSRLLSGGPATTTSARSVQRASSAPSGSTHPLVTLA